MTLKNPCINHCKFDENKICSNCQLKQFEYWNWESFSLKEKIKIFREIPKRIKIFNLINRV